MSWPRWATALVEVAGVSAQPARRCAGDRLRGTTSGGSSGTAGTGARRLAALARRIEACGAPAVHVRRDGGDRGGLVSVQVQPPPGAAPLYWTIWGDEMILGVGTGECRWELLVDDPQDLAFAEAVVGAVLAGRVSEVFGPARSQVTVHLLGGSTEVTSQADAPLGCLPLPSRLRRRRHVQYTSYLRA